MKTIRQRAKDYAKYEAMSQVDCNFQSDEARAHAAALYYDDDAREAYIEGATETLDELKTVLSVSEDKYLRENILKMINYLEGEK
jgi:hypothetical protein